MNKNIKSGKLVLKSHAKLNLTLDILGRRKDGYHEIESIMQQIGLYDSITLLPLKENKILVKTNVKALNNKNNIAYKAASFLKERFNVEQGVKITIKKNIPVKAGLGGGSSNAAAVLRGLNKLWRLNLGSDALKKLAVAIGSDVPFFLSDNICLVKGKGDIIEELPLRHHAFVLVLYPGFGISTRKAYENLDYEKTGKVLATRSSLGHNEVFLHNDFEESIFKKYPVLEKIRDEMMAYGQNVLLAGSGSSLLCFFSERKKAISTYKKLKKRYRELWITETL